LDTSETASSYRIAVVCPYALARAGICCLLDAGGFVVTWQGGDALELLTILDECSPDVILLGWEAHGVDIALVEQLAGELQARVVIMTSPTHHCDLSAALQAGAIGCLSCNSDPEKFLMQLEIAVQGNVVVSQELTSSVIGVERRRLESKLTPRELEVLEALGRGETNGEIAKELYLSPHTVKIHVHEVLTRMGFRNRQQAAAYVASNGVTKPYRLDA